ncbi:GerAB/ArcD/ProY family transporter [Cohnella silvisoli]|uniref:Endospore germination permease n=1 Tax=Cohnella silvisoli TaxID=2873699 RepID=A0ABV1L0N8_9BACL|nr:endospore germination permease [Cohnella silvisoli]MCD9025351.1 spore germination protein [Cohnella silvisoli]
MKKYALNEITFMQFIFLIHGIQVGTGIMSLPKDLAEKSGTDGWMSLIIGWFINIIASYVMIQIFKRFPNDTLYDLLNRLFGKWLSLFISIPVTLYFICAVWLILIRAMLYIKAWFLPQTPDYIVVFLFTIPTFMLARNGLRIMGRYCELVFYLTAWMPFILLLVLGDSHWIHLLPLFKEGMMPVVKGLESTIYSIAGLEITMIVYPFLKNKQSAMLGIVIANSITILAYIYVTIICFAFFSPDEITGYNQPLLSLLKVIEFRFLERFDMIFLAIYLFIVSTSWIPYMFFAAFSVSQLMRKQDHTPYVAVLLVLIIAIVFVIHPSWNQADMWSKRVSIYNIGITFVLPLLLWVYIQFYVRVHKGELH